MMSMDGITPRSTHSRTPITPDMPIYVSFRRAGRRQTQLWYEPMQQENVGYGTCHEVTSGAYRYIAHSAQRRVSVRRLITHCGEFHATYERGVADRPPSARCAADLSQLHNNHLATEARVAMRSGLAAGSVTCACGNVLEWWQRGATSGRSNGTSCSAHWHRSARCADAGALPSSEQSLRSRLA